jgi:L-alanine-DL-glutamate epimerase-like enolase superfamily enzyme
MFKQFMQARHRFLPDRRRAIGGVNEVLAVLILARKFGIPVCPHAGGVGLCEYVQHLSMVDYLCVSASLDGRVIEYVDLCTTTSSTPSSCAAGVTCRPRLGTAPRSGPSRSRRMPSRMAPCGEAP